MTNKFVSWLEHVGQDFKKGLDFALQFAATEGRVAVAILAPSLGPIFNTTVTAVALAEQNLTALGKQSGTGQQKLALVLQIAGPVISQGLIDAGKAGDTAAVTNFINSVVTVLNAAPTPTA